MNEKIQEINGLVEKLRVYNLAYRKGKAMVSDATYDALEDRLRSLDPNNWWLQQLEDEAFLGAQELKIHMGSQSKAMSLDEMKSFYNRTPGQESFFWSLKVDGASLELVYRNGVLIRATTRGNGKFGNDCTKIAKMNPQIPKVLPECNGKSVSVVVRGEWVIELANLMKINNSLKALGRVPYKNCRNGAAAILKSSDNVELARFCSFRAFDVEEIN